MRLEVNRNSRAETIFMTNYKNTGLKSTVELVSSWNLVSDWLSLFPGNAFFFFLHSFITSIDFISAYLLPFSLVPLSLTITLETVHFTPKWRQNEFRNQLNPALIYWEIRLIDSSRLLLHALDVQDSSVNVTVMSITFFFFSPFSSFTVYSIDVKEERKLFERIYIIHSSISHPCCTILLHKPLRYSTVHAACEIKDIMTVITGFYTLLFWYT